MAAILLACAVVSGCSNKEQSAYRLAAQAQQQLEAADVSGARISIDKALAERDDLVELHLLKAKIELRGQSLEGAFASYFNAMALDPVNQEALEGVAMLGLQTGHTSEAEDAAGKLLSLSPRNPSALLAKGLLAVERKRYPEALEAADGILAEAPTDESAVILKIRALFLSGQPDEASVVLARAFQLSGKTQGLSKISLEIARALGDAPAMLRAFADLRQSGQPDGKLTFDEANVRYKTGDRAGAAQLINRDLLEEKIPAAQRIALLSLWEEYDPEAPARGTLKPMQDASLREAIVRYLIDRGRAAEASPFLQGTASPAAQGLQARVALALGQAANAERVAGSVLAADPGQCDALVALTGIDMARSQATAAVTNAQRAAAECPTMREAWLATAKAFAAKGEVRQVERVFRDALERDPDDQPLHAAYIEWLKRNGRADKTVAVARHLIRYAPNRLSTWRLYAATCGADEQCRDEATKGLAKAKASFVIDRRPGELSPRGLLATLASTS